MIEKFKIIQGRKSEKDRILLYYGKAVAFENVARMCLSVKDNYFMTYLKKVLETRRIPKDNKYDEESLPHDIAEMCIFSCVMRTTCIHRQEIFKVQKCSKGILQKLLCMRKYLAIRNFKLKKIMV